MPWFNSFTYFLKVTLILSSEDLRFFALVVRQGSLAAAARVLGVTPPAVTLRLQKLEERVGVRLLDRNTRRATPTVEGELMLEGAQAILARIDALTDGLRERRGHVAGELKVGPPSASAAAMPRPFLPNSRSRILS